MSVTTRSAVVVGALASTIAQTPALGKALRSSAVAGDVDTRLRTLFDQFVADAKVVDPTITGAWTGSDHTIPGRDWALQSVSLERSHAPFIRRRKQTT